jgi:hypothetical protein
MALGRMLPADEDWSHDIQTGLVVLGALAAFTSHSKPNTNASYARAKGGHGRRQDVLD